MVAIVIAGEVVAVNADLEEDINSEMPRADFIMNLEKVGYGSVRAMERADILIDEGYSRARAWATVEREDLIELSIGRGYVDALIDVMQADFADMIGVPFARAVNAGSVVTDEDAVRNIKRGRGCPSFLKVTEDSAFLAEPAEWSKCATGFISWVQNEHTLMGESLQKIYDKVWDVQLDTLPVPVRGRVSKAVGTLMKTR